MRTGLIFLAWFVAFGQPSTFEAASIKPSKPGDLQGATYQFTPGGLTVTNGTLRGLIEMAYDVRDFQLSGGPGWVSSAGYYVSAKSAAGVVQSTKETRRKLQTLLAERFQLTLHREIKDVPAYALLVGKKGSTLAQAGGAGASKGIRTGCGEMTGTRATNPT